MDTGCVAAPGAFNALVARAVAAAGFDACYVSGGATSVAAGVPDVGLLTLDHFARVVREVCDSARTGAKRLPVIADADTGFGEAEMVRRTVVEYHRAGAAGLHIEDQVFPKRCGHLDGKALVPIDHMCEKIRWAVAAARECDGRKRRRDGGTERRSEGEAGRRDEETKRRRDEGGTGFIVCARTDARGVEGMDAAVERAKAYVDAGADMIFPEGLASEDEFAAFATAMRSPPSPLGGEGRGEGSLPPSPLGGEGRGEGSLPPSPLGGEGRGEGSLPPSPRGGNGRGSSRPYLLANMTEFGKTPIIPLSRFEQMGYNLVIFPVTTLRVAMGAVTRALQALHRDGSVESFLDQMQTREDLYRLIAYEPGTAWELPA